MGLVSRCHGSTENCGTADVENPDDGMICGFCHPELVSDHDRQEIRDFERFLRYIAPILEIGAGFSLRWQWVE